MPHIAGDQLRHIIFDLDGTIADTAKATIPALQQISARYALAPVSDQKILDTMGYANPEFYQRLYPGISQALLYTIAAEAEAAEERFVRALGKSILFPGIDLLLGALKTRGLTLHIASTGDHAHVHAVLEAAGIKSLFTTISCGAPTKADMVAKIIAHHDCAAFAMIGDKVHDLKAARANNILAIAAVYGYCSSDDAANFDCALKSPGELIALIQANP